MDTKKFSQALERESKGWVDHGLLTPDQRLGILGLYPTVGAPRSVWGASALVPVLGALLVGAGLIALVAWNWEGLSAPAKWALAVLPLVASQVFLAMAWARRLPLLDTAVVLVTLAVGLALAVVTQLYQMQGPLFGLLVSVVVLSLPVVLLTRSLPGGLLSVALTLAAFLGGSWEEPEAGWALLVFFAVPLLAWLRHRLGGKSSESLLLAGAAAALWCLTMVTAPFLPGTLFLVQLVVLASLVSLAVVSPAVRTAAQGLVVVLLLFLGFSGVWFEVPGRAVNTLDLVAALPPLWLVLAALALLATGVGTVVVQGSRLSAAAGLAVVALWLINPWLVANHLPWVPVVAVNAAVVALGLTWLLKKGQTPARLLGGIALVLLVVNQRFFDGEFPLWIKGLVFVASGLLLWGYQAWRNRAGEKS